MLIKNGVDVEKNMEQLYMQVKSFIGSVAYKFRGSKDIEDLEQEGYLALYPAIEGYDPAAGFKFLTYAEYHIRQRMQRYIQNNGSCLRLPVHCLERVQKYKKFQNSFRLKYGREPSDRETAALLGISLEHVEEIKGNACMARLGSLDSFVTGADGAEETTIGELVSSDLDIEGDVLDQVQQEQLKTALWECVDSLPGQQAEAIRARYRDGLTLKETGERLGTTSEGARQWEAKALRKLRSGSNRRRLVAFFPEYDRIYSMSIAAVGHGHFERTWTSATERAAIELFDDEWTNSRRRELEPLEKRAGANKQQNLCFHAEATTS